MFILTRALLPHRSSCQSGRIVALQCSGERFPPVPGPQDLCLDAAASLPHFPCSPRPPAGRAGAGACAPVPCRVRAAGRGSQGGGGHRRVPRALALAGQCVPGLPAPLWGLRAGPRVDPHGSSLCAQVPRAPCAHPGAPCAHPIPGGSLSPSPAPCAHTSVLIAPRSGQCPSRSVPGRCQPQPGRFLRELSPAVPSGPRRGCQSGKSSHTRSTTTAAWTTTSP